MTDLQKLPMLVPVTSERLCLSLTAHSTIHASLLAPLACASSRAEFGGAAMTLCGSHAFIIGHPTPGRTHTVAPSWPCPILDRCVDCARLTGIGRRQQKGSAHWQNLTNP